MIKGVKKANVTACKKAVCTAPVDGHTKKPQPAPPPETPRTVPKEQMRGSVPATPGMAIPATVKTMLHHRPVQKMVYTITGKRAVIVSCKEIKLRNLQITRMASLENVTIDGLFPRNGKLD